MMQILKLFLNKLDCLLGDIEFKKAYLGERYEKYQYMPLLRESGNEKYPKYIKLKLECVTQIYNTVNDTREKVEFINIANAAKEIPYRSTIRFIFKPCSIWKQNANMRTPMYGLTLKACKIEVKKSAFHAYDETTCEFLD